MAGAPGIPGASLVRRSCCEMGSQSSFCADAGTAHARRTGNTRKKRREQITIPFVLARRDKRTPLRRVLYQIAGRPILYARRAEAERAALKKKPGSLGRRGGWPILSAYFAEKDGIYA